MSDLEFFSDGAPEAVPVSTVVAAVVLLLKSGKVDDFTAIISPDEKLLVPAVRPTLMRLYCAKELD